MLEGEADLQAHYDDGERDGSLACSGYIWLGEHFYMLPILFLSWNAWAILDSLCSPV
jgi:hypothetical protein